MNWIKKHKILTVITAIIIIAAIGSVSNNKSNIQNNQSTKANATKKLAAHDIKIGQAARDGKFEFVVKSIQCGVVSVGDNPYLTKTAQGQYCLLSVTVKNIGNEKQSLFSSNQKLKDAANKEYSADDTATLYAAPNGSSWYTDINPGNSVEGQIAFDIPKDLTPSTAELHDSAYSGGVTVNLQ